MAARESHSAAHPPGLRCCVRALVEDHYPQAKKIRLVQDNLNTHDGASLYEAFPPQKARRILDKTEVPSLIDRKYLS